MPASQELQRVELQMNQLQKESDRRDNQARQALAQGREDLARAALQSKASLRASSMICRRSSRNCRIWR